MRRWTVYLALLCVGVLIGGGATATADKFITGSDIKDGSIALKDLKPALQRVIKQKGKPGSNGSNGLNGVNGANGRDGAQGADGTPGSAGARGQQGETGRSGADGLRGEQGPAGPQGEPGPRVSSGNWGIINRNTYGSPSLNYRSGPAGTRTGSLNVLVQDGTQKFDFGNEVDFLGQSLSGYTDISYRVFYGADEPQTQNAPAPNFEINPGIEGRTYTSVVYVGSRATADKAYTWETLDTTADVEDHTSGWYFTNGAVATATGCGQGAGQRWCDWDEILERVPDARVISFGITKGRDNAFAGALDWFKMNETTFDLTENGVVADGPERPTPVR